MVVGLILLFVPAGSLKRGNDVCFVPVSEEMRRSYNTLRQQFRLFQGGGWCIGCHSGSMLECGVSRHLHRIERRMIR